MTKRELLEALQPVDMDAPVLLWNHPEDISRQIEAVEVREADGNYYGVLRTFYEALSDKQTDFPF